MNRVLERILIVDDDQYIQEIIAAALEDYGGYTVAGCSSGAIAVELAPTFKPDLIMLDMVMPGMDGRMALEALRAVSAVADTPAIFLTAQSMDVSHCRQLPGVIGALAKRLLTIVHRQCRPSFLRCQEIVSAIEYVAAS